MGTKKIDWTKHCKDYDEKTKAAGPYWQVGDVVYDYIKKANTKILSVRWVDYWHHDPGHYEYATAGHMNRSFGSPIEGQPLMEFVPYNGQKNVWARVEGPMQLYKKKEV